MKAGSRRRVLIVDDDEAVRIALRLMLDDHHDVLEAGDGGAAIDLLEGHRVDVMVLDLLLPKADGFEVLQRVRALSPHVPVIVISAINTSWTASTAMRLGAVDYITKPFDDAQVLTAIAESLDPARRGDEHRATPRHRPRILCVGVPLGMRATLSIVLGESCSVEAATDIATALVRLKEESPDAIIVEVSTETLRTHPEPVARLRRHFPDGHIIAMVAGDDVATVATRRDSGLALLRRPVSIRVLLREIATVGSQQAHRWSGFGEATRRTLDHLAEHYADATIDAVGKTMRMAPYYLSARFRQEVGMPLKAYLQALRIEVAKTSLVETFDSITTIAGKVGLHDASHLSRIFTAHVGCRPGEYRRQQRAPANENGA